MNSFINLNLTNAVSYILLAISAAICVALCFVMYKLLNKIPAKWLCDYGEEPDKSLYAVRFNYKKSGIAFTAVMLCINIICVLTYAFSWYLLFAQLIIYTMSLIALCDFKYAIIPDQFTIMLAVFSLGFAVSDIFGSKIFISQWWQIFAGAAIGAVFLITVNLLSKLLFKKDGMGFGDVKLTAAFGAALGIKYVLISMLLAIFIAFVYIIFALVKAKIKKAETSHYFPFGPFLCVGAVCVFLFFAPINSLIEMYIQMLAI